MSFAFHLRATRAGFAPKNIAVVAGINEWIKVLFLCYVISRVKWVKFYWRLDFRQGLHLLWAERTIGYFVTQYWNSFGVYSQRLKCFLLTWNKVVILVIHYFSVFVGVIVGVLLANPCTEEVRARSFVVFVHSCVRTFTGLFIQVCRKIFNSFKLASLVWRILIFMICSLLCF